MTPLSPGSHSHYGITMETRRFSCLSLGELLGFTGYSSDDVKPDIMSVCHIRLRRIL